MSTNEDLWNGIKDTFQNTKTFEQLTDIFNTVPIADINKDYVLIYIGLAFIFKKDIAMSTIETYKDKVNRASHFSIILIIHEIPPNKLMHDVVIAILDNESLFNCYPFNKNIILGSINKKMAKIRKYDPLYLSIRDYILKDIKPLIYESHSFDGTICDTLGSRQHVGECWLDSITQLFMFADGLKEITQPLLYNSESDIIKYIQERRHIIPEGLHIESFIEAIRVMSRRFTNHYDFLKDPEHAFCLTTNSPQTVLNTFSTLDSPKTSLKRSASSRNAVLLATLVKSFAKKEDDITIGESIDLVRLLWIILLKIFKLPFQIDDSPNSSTIALYINYTYILSTNDISEYNHAVGFYRCNNRWHYYNDENGLFIVDIDLIYAFFDSWMKKHYYICIRTVEDRVYLILINIHDKKPAFIFIKNKWVEFHIYAPANAPANASASASSDERIKSDVNIILTTMEHLNSYLNMVTDVIFINEDPIKQATKLLTERAGTATISASGPIHNVSQIKPNSFANKEHVEAYEKTQAATSSSRKKNRRVRKQRRRTRRRLRH